MNYGDPLVFLGVGAAALIILGMLSLVGIMVLGFAL